MSKLRTGIDVNGSAGAYVSVTSTIPARKVTISEDPTVTAQGLTYQLPNDNYTATYTLPSGSTLVLGNTLGQQGSGMAPVLGIPAQQTAPDAWSGATAYKVGDTVTSSSVTYYAIKAGTNKTPASNTDYWTPFVQWNLRTADTYIKIKSKTTTATKIQVLEED